MSLNYILLLLGNYKYINSLEGTGKRLKRT